MGVYWKCRIKFQPFKFSAFDILGNRTLRLTSTIKRLYQTKSVESSLPIRRILFLGSDAFSIKSFEAVNSVFRPPSQIHVVVSNLNNVLAKYIKGQQSDTSKNFVTLDLWDKFKKQVSSDSNFVKFDLGVVSSFGHLVPSMVINQCQMGILNVHGSLLPRWRGAAPTAAAIMNGETVTGVSIMKIAPHRFDIGPVLHQVQVPLDSHIRTPELTSLLATIGADALKHVLQNFNHYLTIALPQDESLATKAPKLSPEISTVNWSKMDALQVYNLFRGVSGRYKLRTRFQNRPVDLEDISILEIPDTKHSPYSTYYKYSTTVAIPPEPLSSLTQTAQPGDIHYLNQVLCVKCQCSSKELRLHWIFIRKVKINQKWMSALDFRNGWLSKVEQYQRHFDSVDLLQMTAATIKN